MIHPHGFQVEWFLARGDEVLSFEKNGIVVRVTSREMYNSTIRKKGKPVRRGVGPINSDSNEFIVIFTVCPRKTRPNEIYINEAAGIEKVVKEV